MAAFRFRPADAPGFDRAFWLLALLAVVVIGAGIGLRDPWPVDEPRFALIARDMVVTGNWLFPHIAGQLYPDKPPLFMWTIAAFYWLTGSLRIAFLLPSLVAGLGTLWLVFDLGRKLWSRRVGLMAATVLLVTLQFALLAKRAQIDAYECLWTTLGLYGLLRHLLRGPAWGWYWAGFAAMGLGIITKGVGFLPVFVFIPYAFACLRHWPRLPKPGGGFWRWALGPLAMLAAIGVWLAPMLIVVALSADPRLAAYRDNILFHQTAGRYAAAWHHFQPPWYYIVDVIPVFWLPLSVAVLWLAPAWWRRLARRDVRYLLLLGWVVLVVIFFTLSAGKRGVYLLPALPAFALAAAPLMTGLLRLKSARWTALGIVLLAAVCGSLALAYFLLVEPDKAAALAVRYNVDPWGFIGALTGAAWVAALLGRARRGARALAAFFLSIWVIYGFYGYPLINPDRSAAALMERVDAALAPADRLAIVDWRAQYVLHADRSITHFGYRRGGDRAEVADALAWAVQSPRRWVLIDRHALANSCVEPQRALDIGYRSGDRWYLINRTMLTPACQAQAQTDGPPTVVYESLTPPGVDPEAIETSE
ncbi:MAG TPA: glycosyltransferase family 39 protein [Gammaproteobacteria bacterium]|nr:glycosyltransferase family 39 protein [Gammaproteobacteria bacterium]